MNAIIVMRLNCIMTILTIPINDDHENHVKMLTNQQNLYLTK